MYNVPVFLYMLSHVFFANITCLYNIIVSGLTMIGIAQDESSEQCHNLLSLTTILEIPT